MVNDQQGLRWWKLVCCVLFLCLIGCRPAAIEPPIDSGDGWQVGSLSDAGIDPQAIARLDRDLDDGDYGWIHSCLIVRHGQLVFERYYRGQERDWLHVLFSVSKSVSSALVDIAIREGQISSVDVPVVSFFPDINPSLPDENRAIALEHLLTQSTGLKWDESTHDYGHPENSLTQTWQSDNWPRYVLSQPLLHSPGTHFLYSTGNSHLLAGIIQDATGMDAERYAESKLFGPLGIDAFNWQHNDQDVPMTGGTFGGLKLRPRDMAKFGLLYLNDGLWDGKQIVPSEWVRMSLEPHIEVDRHRFYGYQWWVQSVPGVDRAMRLPAALGYGGQAIYLLPDLDMVVVFTADEDRPGDIYRALEFIVRATDQG